MATSYGSPLTSKLVDRGTLDACVKQIPVKIGSHPYNVVVGAGLLRRVGRELRRLMPAQGSRVFVVTSSTVRRHWGHALEESLALAKLSTCWLEMNDGEPAKRLATIEQLAEQLVRAGADRKSLLVAFGGGVVGDCGGFLASVFMRGIPVVQVPTTLIAQADAAIGGKTGVNLSVGKNLLGTFHQPKAVLVDPRILETLDEREFRSGLFEALRCGVIRDRELFDFMTVHAREILARDRRSLERLIVACVRVKAAVVAADEREAGLRRILNFGHTIGHALEAATGYAQLLHGEAVALGMLAATAIAQNAGFCGPRTAARIVQGITEYQPPAKARVQHGEVSAYLGSDKKNVNGKVHWVLPVRLGRVTVSSEVPDEAVRSAIREVCC